MRASLSALSAALLFAASGAFAQVNKKITDGIVPYTVQQGSPRGSYRLDDFDSVSVYSGRLNVSVPLLSLGARGQAGYTVSARVSLPPWTPELELRSSPCSDNRPGYPQESFYYVNKGTSLWWTAHRARFGPGMVVYKRTGWQEESDTRSGGEPIRFFGKTYSHVVFLAPDGTEHALHENRTVPIFAWNVNNYTLPPADRQRQNFRSVDSPGMTFRSDSPITDTSTVTDLSYDEVSLNINGWLRFADGMRYRVEQGKIAYIEDRNGNRMVFTYESITPEPGTAPGVLFTHRITKATDSIGRETFFDYGVSDQIDGTTVIVDRIRYLGGASGTSQRKILIERKAVVNQLAFGFTASTNLFGDLTDSGTNVIQQQVISRIAFDNNTKYTFRYNQFGEVAQAILPTGGRVDYTHGPGVTTGSGVFTAGRVLTSYGIDYAGGQSQCVPRPTGNPLWQPLIYRRLLTRAVFPSESATVPEKISEYRNNESVTSGECYYGSTSICSVFRVAVASPGFLETRETAQNNLALPDKVHRHFYHPGNNIVPAPTGPLDRVQKEKASNYADLVAYPDPYDGKELKTETGTGVSTFLPLQRSESTFSQLADGSVRPCQERQTLITGGATKSSQRSLFYDAFPATSDNQIFDPSSSLLYGALAVRFSNLTDAYDYDWDQSSVPAFGTCATPTSNTYLRRTRYEYQANGVPAYRQWDSHLLQLPSLMTVYGSGDDKASESTYAYDQTTRISRGSVVNHVLPASTRMRGNLTSISNHIDGATVATVQREYDELGNIVAEIDPKLARTDYLYDDANYTYSPGGTFAFLSAIDRPAVAGSPTRQRTSWRINYRSGAVTRLTAPNGTITNYDYADPLDRLTLAERAVGSSVGNLVTRYQYFDTVGQTKVSSVSDRYTSDDGQRIGGVCYDGFGRDVRTISQGGSTSILSGKVIDGFGRVARSYNPALANNDCTSPLTGPSSTIQYDALDRALQSTTPGGAVTLSAYSVNETTTTDPASKCRKQARDALGRIVAVTEDACAGGANLLTTYGYDGDGRLLSVNQGGQPRSFTYDLLGRLLTANNPESGLISHTYDLNGNLVSRQDSRPALSCFGVITAGVCNGGSGYDALNRPLTKQNANPATAPAAQIETITYCYDGRTKTGATCGGSEVTLQLGQLTSVGNANSATDHSYDAVGRMTASTQRTVGLANQTFTYGYYRSDVRGETQYPSGRRVVTCADALLRPVWVSASRTMADCQQNVAVANAETYANGVQYAPHGAMNQLTFGNGLLESASYNADLQPERMRLGSFSGGGSVACGQAGDTWCLELGYGAASGNNGNLVTQGIFARKTDGTGLSLQQTYGYDALNRLTTFNESVVSGGSATPWSQTNQYDRWGNRWATSSITQHAQTPTQAGWINAANNRIVNSTLGALTYDGAGNLTVHPQLGNLAYDAENRVTSFGGSSSAFYLYDGQGRRVKRTAAGTDTYYVYDGSGNLAAEYSSAASLVGRRYLTGDHLGTTRAITDADGNVKSRCDYLPFGDPILAVATQGNRDQLPEYACTEGDVRQKFTGKERDAETGLDYFGARYMSAAQGRFTSVDPHNIITEASSPEEFGSFLSHPQNWNRYAYVANNPLSTVDPDGRCPACMMWARLSPYADKAVSAVQRGGQSGYLWATSFFNSPAGQQAIQTTAELASGTVMPGSPIAGVNAQMGSRILTALGSSDAAKQVEGKVAQSLANSGLLKGFDVTVAGRQIDAIAGKAGEFVVEVTTGGGRGKIAQALAQMKDTGKQVVIYGEDLSKGFVKEAQKQGIRVAQNLEELKKLVSGQ